MLDSGLRTKFKCFTVVHNRGWQTFSVKRQEVNISGFEGLVSSCTHLCPCIQEAAVSNMSMNEHGHVPIKLYYNYKTKLKIKLKKNKKTLL